MSGGSDGDYAMALHHGALLLVPALTAGSTYSDHLRGPSRVCWIARRCRRRARPRATAEQRRTVRPTQVERWTTRCASIPAPSIGRLRPECGPTVGCASCERNPIL